MQRLLLIDGNAILYRAYHAYPPSFTDRQGNPTNAIYGFFAMLIKMLDEIKPDYVGIPFDQGAPTFRMELYAGYHANRPPMEDSLISQVQRLQDKLSEIGIPLFMVEGYEADDLLGTLSRLATLEKLETIIVTGDRDLLQLVTQHVKVLMPLLGITKTALFDERRVEEKYGVKPSQFIDYKALVGDQSDGYPGVTGIGPKTAAMLLQQFGTFENLYTRISELPEAVAKKLAIDAEQAALAKKLATIHRDGPVHLILKECSMKNFGKEKFAKVFDELGFESLKKRVLGETVLEEKSEQENKKNIEQLGLL